VVAPLAWAFPVDALVTRFKYGGALHYGRSLGLLLAASVADRPVHAVLPVPLHPSRQAERGFNQARELARPAAAAAGAPLWPHGCRRVRDTVPQAGLSGTSRRRNPSGAFVASARVEGLDVAVVDDVLTTGATAVAVTAALRAAGAARVEIWAVARGGLARGRPQARTKV
jgi:ComF family protein